MEQPFVHYFQTATNPVQKYDARTLEIRNGRVKTTVQKGLSAGKKTNTVRTHIVIGKKNDNCTTQQYGAVQLGVSTVAQWCETHI